METAAQPFDVRNLWTGEVVFTAQIECAADASDAVKLGLAAQWAAKNNVSVFGADLSDANLRGANLSGAIINDTPVHTLLAVTTRMSTGREWRLWAVRDGPAMISAGCRWMTIADYRLHVAKEYPGTPKAGETLRILDYFEAVERAALVAADAGEGV